MGVSCPLMREQVREVLDAFRPVLARHRGDIELVGVDEGTGVVTVRFLGTCAHCPLSDLTLAGGVEEVMKERVPGVTSVVAV